MRQLHPHEIKQARAEAWNTYVREYTSAVDHDPGDARKRYHETIARIQQMEARK